MILARFIRYCKYANVMYFSCAEGMVGSVFIPRRLKQMKKASHRLRILKQLFRPRFLCAVAALALMTSLLRAQPTILVPPTDQTAPTGFTATFGLEISSAPPFGYQWYFNNQLISGATNHILNILDAQATNQGSYVVVVTNSSGAATNSPVTLTVTNVPTQAPSVQFNTLASFDQFVDGSFPQAGVIQGSDGYLYGTTSGGSTNYPPGSTNGTAFKMSTNGAFVWSFGFNLADGITPIAGLVQAGNGVLYGVANLGGVQEYGTVFSFTTNGAFSRLYSFGDAEGGSYPQGTLCAAEDGYLYGTTSFGGPPGGGTVFKMNTNGGTSLVWSVALTSSTGWVPLAGLVQGLDGSLYGTTSQGGASNAGTVFRISTNGVLTNLYSFTGSTDGGSPAAGLVQGPDSQLYGTTAAGGNPNVNGGSIFKITTNGAFTLLLDFDGTNGGSPLASLMLAGDGNFYGTTVTGGAGYPFSFNTLFGPVYGTIFQLTTNGALTTLVSFDGNYGGAAPESALWQGRDGGLYGTTYYGGTNDLSINGESFGDGTVFRLGVVPPTIKSAVAQGGTFSFTWNAMPGELYQAQYKDSLTEPAWIDFGGLVEGTNGIAGQSDIITATNKARYYRVSLQF
jgi:uncharacterized repeat protein (TIGR03803 family)